MKQRLQKTQAELKSYNEGMLSPSGNICHLVLGLVCMTLAIVLLVLDLHVNETHRNVYMTYEVGIGGISDTSDPSASLPILLPGSSTNNTVIAPNQYLEAFKNALSDAGLTFANDGFTIGVPFTSFSPVILVAVALFVSAAGHMFMFFVTTRDYCTNSMVGYTVGKKAKIDPEYLKLDSNGNEIPDSAAIRGFAFEGQYVYHGTQRGFYGLTSVFIMITVAIVCGIRTPTSILFLCGLQAAICFLAFIVEMGVLYKDSPMAELVFPAWAMQLIISSLQWIAIAINNATTYVDIATVWSVVGTLWGISFLYNFVMLIVWFKPEFGRKWLESAYVVFDFGTLLFVALMTYFRMTQITEVAPII